MTASAFIRKEDVRGLNNLANYTPAATVVGANRGLYACISCPIWDALWVSMLIQAPLFFEGNTT